MRIVLEERLDVWVREGLVSADQADRIRAREGRAGRDDDRRSVLAESIGYLGAALTVVATGLVLGEWWDRIAPWGRLVLALTLTVAVFAAGWVLRHRESGTIRRLTSVLWFATAVGVAASAGLAAEQADLADRATALVVAVCTTVAAAALHRRRPAPLQVVALAAGVIGVAMTALAYPEASVDELYTGLLLWAVGVAFLLLGAGGWLMPPRTTQVVGLLASGVGCQVAAVGEPGAVGLVLALVSAGALLWVATAIADTVLLSFAVAGVFVFAPQAVFEFFADSIGAPLALLLAGLLLVAAAVGLVVLRREITEVDR